MDRMSQGQWINVVQIELWRGKLKSCLGGTPWCFWLDWLSLEQMGLQDRGLTNAPTVWPNGLCKDSPTELLLHQGHWTTGFSWSYSAAQGTFCQLPTPGWADLSKYRHLECEILTHASTETYTNWKTVVIPFIYIDRQTDR